MQEIANAVFIDQAAVTKTKTRQLGARDTDPK